MVQGRLGEAATIMGGEMISGSAAAMWRGATLDSRQVNGGELFFALAGERTDGHRFVGQALERGAAAAIVQREMEIPADGGAIRVPDTLEALHSLTREVRTREPRKLVGITGSAGKTTTKEMLAAMLARRFRVARNPGSLNNTLGFPVALLGIPEGTEWMVAEMGMSTPGELRQVSRLGKPDVAVFLNVRPVHLEAFGTLEAIREAKAELLDGLAEDGLVVANQDDRQVVEIAHRHAGRVIWFGRQTTADYRVEDVESLADGRVGSRFKLVTRRGCRGGRAADAWPLQRRQLPGRGGLRQHSRCSPARDRPGRAGRDSHRPCGEWFTDSPTARPLWTTVTTPIRPR